MGKRLFIRTRIFFKNPVVVRAIYAQYEDLKNSISHMRQIFRGTWGFSEGELNYVKMLISGISGENPEYSNYWCFADETDALQFMLLSKSIKSNIVSIWPSKLLFTITEYYLD